jgi:radical SAM superfamily enzyme YgiQ (UPF0313 family)
MQSFQPDAVGFGVNYLANVPEVIDLAKLVRQILPKAFVFCGGHSISFIAGEVLAHGDGAIDAIVTGEGETTVPLMLERIPRVDGVANSRRAVQNPCRTIGAGQTNFLKMLFRFSKAYNVDRFYADHFKEVKYSMRRPSEYKRKMKPQDLLVHLPGTTNLKESAVV